jgi:hypothetical protein
MTGAEVRYVYEPGRVLFEADAGRILDLTPDELALAPRARRDTPSLASVFHLEK